MTSLAISARPYCTAAFAGGPASAWLSPPITHESAGTGPAGPVGFLWEPGGITILGVSPPASSALGGTVITVMATSLDSAAASDRGGAGVLGCVFGSVGQVAGRAVRGRGVTANKHSIDVESPHPPPYTLRVCMSIHPEGKSCSNLG